jgi:PAS domain S-box-containing protein
LEKAFKGEVIFDSEIVNDEWGSWVSAFVPMHDVSGQVEAVLGVDFDAHEWLAGTARARHAAIWVVAFFIALILGCGMGIALLRADITQRIAAERRLRESEERLRLTIRQMPLGFIEWSMAAEVCVWNPSAERIFGHAAAEVEGRKIFPVIVAPSAKDRVDELWDNLVCNAGGTHSVNENITKDGRIILCEWFNTPLVGADGKVTAVFSLFQDITDRVLLEQKLQSSERLSAVGQLSAGVAHDFNNILTVILGHAGLLQVRPGMTADARQDVRRIEEAATRAASLTRQLLAFSRRQAMFPRTLDLGKTVQDVAGMLSRLIRADMKFQVTVAGNVPPVEADPAMIEQVVTNLVINARDALESPGGEIAVGVDTFEILPAAVPPFPNACAGRFVRLTVRDNGMGIPAENLARIFEPFFTTKAQGKGTGLGLSVVHGIVEQHGGWISVHSQPGKGTAFAIHLPPSDKPLTVGDTTMLVRPAAPAAKKVRTILLAEDEPFVRELAVKILENAGYAVIAVPDGLCALEKWGKQRDQIDLLFTDMVMPNGIGGRELSERILADQPQLPVIYASGYSIDTTAPGFCESERMLFLQKPYKPEQLLAAVHKCLEQTAA